MRYLSVVKIRTGPLPGAPTQKVCVMSLVSLSAVERAFDRLTPALFIALSLALSGALLGAFA